jgi:hypothetical protein
MMRSTRKMSSSSSGSDCGAVKRGVWVGESGELDKFGEPLAEIGE